jgi:hypothetical protein
MSESRGGSVWYLWLAGAAILLLAAWFFTPLPMIVGICFSISDIRLSETRMQRPEIYLPVATNLALYCQSAEDLQLTNKVRAASLPQPLPSLGSRWASFRTNFAIVECGGGFHQYGYRAQLDEAASTPQRNVWQLYLCREGQSEKLLHRFALAPTARVSMSEFTSNSVAEYNRRLAKSPHDLGLHKDKISFLLKHRPNEVRAACLDAIGALPQHWWPRLTLALVDTRKGQGSAAALEMVKYVEAKPSYSRYTYLAYFYELIDKPKEAAQAIQKAITFPIVDLDDDENNTECRGYTLGVYAFRNREYSTVIKLCDALLPIKENGDYAKAALRGLKSAAESEVAGMTASFTPSEDVLHFNVYERFDIGSLAGR